MKFLCVSCDERMDFAQRDVPGDGTLSAVFQCPACERAVAMLTNPMETRLVSSMGVEIGGSQVPEQPMETTRAAVSDPREGAFESDPGGAADAGAASAGDADGAAGEAGAESAGGGDDEPSVGWSPAAVDRLGRVPSFVRGMVERIYTDWARERGIATITPDVMDRARSDLGLEGM